MGSKRLAQSRWERPRGSEDRPNAARLGVPASSEVAMHQPPIPHLAVTDPDIAGLVQAEARRQYEKIRLIASENYVSPAVLEATGTVLTNKYSEGYPGRRYYEGQRDIDLIETLAIDRATGLC